MATTPQALARSLEREGRAALRSSQLGGTVTAGRRPDDRGREHWVVADPARIYVPSTRMAPLPGSWFVRMAWDVYADPAGGDAQVQMSSVSLNVEGIPLTAAGDMCLIRYDTNRFDDAPARRHSAVHVNVLQPPALNSRVHYPVFGVDWDRWPLAAVLNFFLSTELRHDLALLAA